MWSDACGQSETQVLLQMSVDRRDLNRRERAAGVQRRCRTVAGTSCRHRSTGGGLTPHRFRRRFQVRGKLPDTRPGGWVFWREEERLHDQVGAGNQFDHVDQWRAGKREREGFHWREPIARDGG